MIKTLGMRRLPRLGTIRLGVKEIAASGKSYPKNVEYFVIPDELKPLIGERPTRIPVMFPANEPERVLESWLEKYEGGGQDRPGVLTIRCDGERYTKIPREGGEQETGACLREINPETGAALKPCECGATAVGRLNVMVLGGPIGIYQVVMGSERQIAALTFDLRLYHRTFGSLTEIQGRPIPFELIRQEETMSYLKDGKRQARTWNPVRLTCGITNLEAMAYAGIQVLTSGKGGAAPALPPASEQDVDDHAHDHEDVEWDISLCTGTAVKLGVAAPLYFKYLEAQYRVDRDNLPPSALLRERGRLQGVEHGSEQAKALVRDMVDVVNKDLAKGRRG